MPINEACDAARSLLPALEPLLGVSVAINLAYLNLSKFAYISVVKYSIDRRLKNLDDSVRRKVEPTLWFRQMQELASVETLDHGLPWRGRWWVQAPNLWGKLYNILFYWRVGRALSIVALLHALTLLILGVGHGSGVMTRYRCHFAEGKLGDDYTFAIIGLLWPIAMVTAGALICSAAARFVRYQTDNLAQEAKSDAREALDRSEQAVNDAAPSQMGPHAG